MKKKQQASVVAHEVEQELLTIEQVAVILNLSRAKVYDLVSRGKLRATRIDTSVRIRRSRVSAFIDESEEEAG